MDYLIDGHNLIPHVPGLSLRDPEDEQRLAERVLAFCRAGRHRAEVYFDGAPPTQARRQSLGGRVTLIFVPQGRTADDAIRARLRRLGRAARNVAVVSADRQVQAAARAAGARVIPSAEFARRLLPQGDVAPGAEKPEAVSPDEVEEWLRLFGET